MGSRENEDWALAAEDPRGEACPHQVIVQLAIHRRGPTHSTPLSTMKFFAALAVASLAVVSAQTAAPCDQTKLVTIATGADGKACTAATGYSAATLKIPVGDVLTKVCSNADCQKLLASITAAVPTECTFGTVNVKADLIDKFQEACKSVSSGTADAAGSGAAANATVTTAPSTGASSAAGATTEVTSGSTTGSTTGSATTTTKSPSSSVPTPSPTSSASTVAAVTGAVVMAVAATLL